MFGIILERFIHVIQSASSGASDTSSSTTSSNSHSSRIGSADPSSGPGSSSSGRNNNDTNESLLQAISTKQSAIAENLKELSLAAGTKSTPQSVHRTKDGRYGVSHLFGTDGECGVKL